VAQDPEDSGFCEAKELRPVKSRPAIPRYNHNRRFVGHASKDPLESGFGESGFGESGFSTSRNSCIADSRSAKSRSDMACGTAVASGVQVEAHRHIGVRGSGIHSVSESRHFMCRFPDRENLDIRKG
jgi:hypothetical protein